MRGLVVFGGLVSLLAWPPASAEACSCGHQPPVISPADGATEVPLNAIVIVRFAYAPSPTVALHDVTNGATVPLQLEERRPGSTSKAATVFGVPAAALRPHTTYRVETTDGLLGLPPEHTRAEFTTGDALDEVAPAFAGLQGMAPETMRYPVVAPDGSSCINSCVVARDGHISRLRVEHPPLPEDAVHVALELLDASQLVVDEVPLPRFGEGVFGFETCDVRAPTLEPGADYCARLVAYDVAGNQAGRASVVCATARSCAPMLEPGRTCQPAEGCSPVDPPDESLEPSGCAASRRGTLGVLPILGALLGLAIRRRRRAA